MNTNWNFSRKDLINSSASLAMQNIAGEAITIVGIAVAERPDENGEVKTVVLFNTKEHGVVSSISDTILRVVDDIIAYAQEEGLEELPAHINKGTSKNGREFLTVTLD